MLVAVALPLRPLWSDDIAAVHFQLAGKNIGIRFVADGDEATGSFQVLRAAIHGGFDAYAG